MTTPGPLFILRKMPDGFEFPIKPPKFVKKDDLYGNLFIPGPTDSRHRGETVCIRVSKTEKARLVGAAEYFEVNRTALIIGAIDFALKRTDIP